MNKSKIWEVDSKNTITWSKKLLGGLAENVRNEQYNIFFKIIKPKIDDKVLDVGVSSEEDIRGTNLFEKKYPYSKNVTAATIENKVRLQKIYPQIRVVKIKPNKKLIFKDNAYDVVVSWATLEHVGDLKDQEYFINELLRVGKKVFITTPYRGCIYEPHSGLFFVHWLPLKIFRLFCKHINKKFWSIEQNLNPLYISNIKKMKLIKKPKFVLYKMFGIIPSHILINF